MFTLWLATFVIFMAANVLPGNELRAIFGVRRPPPAVLEQLEALYHYNDPWLVQYGHYVWGLLRGDLGYSLPTQVAFIQMGPPAESLIVPALPISLKLLALALIVQVVVGVGAGVVAAVRSGTVVSRSIYAGSVLVVSIPVIVLAFVGQTYFGYQLGWLPVVGARGPWTSWILPVVALSGASTASVVLLTRSGLVETLRERFVAAAHARSLSRRRIVAVHALRASFVPVLTFVAANLGQLVTGLLIVEGIFGIPGIGGLLFRSIRTQDKLLLVAIVSLVTLAVIIANFLVDLFAGAIDPRIRHE